MKGGQVKEVIEIPKIIIKTTGDITNDVTKGLSKSLGGLTNGLEIIANNAGLTLDKISKNLEVISVEVFPKVGNMGLETSKRLGNIIQVIPILGMPVAYIISGSAKGVYYIVTSIGNITGKAISSVGKVSKVTSDLIVFTISSTSNATQKTIDEAGNTVKKVAYHIINKNKKKI